MSIALATLTVPTPPPPRAGCAAPWAPAWRALAAWLVGPLLGLAALVPTCAWDAERMAAAGRQAGPRASESVRALQRVLAAATDQDDEARLSAINQFVNRRIVFRPDAEVWGAADYWASPLESFERGTGDCEDYAIAKYFSLLAAGVPVARLRLVYVREQSSPGAAVQAHMVLAYYATPAAEPLVLDNLIGDIRPASRRPDLTPVFSFNSEGLWQGTAGPSVGDATARLSQWRQVLAKAREEGFL